MIEHREIDDSGRAGGILSKENVAKSTSKMLFLKRPPGIQRIYVQPTSTTSRDRRSIRGRKTLLLLSEDLRRHCGVYEILFLNAAYLQKIYKLFLIQSKFSPLELS